MIKHINHQNVSTAPFVATKARALYNIQGDETIITEPNVYADGTHISLDYVDYNFGDPVLNKECNIALEQQGDVNSLGYELGITGSIAFNPSSDLRNTDGTYQTLVHQTIKNAFYNTYRNPIKIFGVEHIDFPLSKTLRNLSDHFRMFTIPRLIFGEKIQPKSVRFYDNGIDDNVSVYDDGYQNLIAGYNLFSRIQEIRKWPVASNYVLPGTASCNCVAYDTLDLTNPSDVFARLGTNISFSVIASGAPRPITLQWYTGSIPMSDGGQISGSNGPVLYISNIGWQNTGSYRVMAHNAESKGATSSYATLFITSMPVSVTGSDSMSYAIATRFGSLATNPPYLESPSFGATLLTGSVQTVIFTSYAYDTASVSMGFDSGYIFNVVIPAYGGNDTASVAMGFDSGYIFDVIIPVYGGNDTASVAMGFDGGSISNVVIEQTNAELSPLFGVGLVSGSVS